MMMLKVLDFYENVVSASVHLIVVAAVKELATHAGALASPEVYHAPPVVVVIKAMGNVLDPFLVFVPDVVLCFHPKYRQ
jgi:hypothetical protein